MIVIRDASAEFIREPLLAPFGFKGNHVDELWQSVVRLRSDCKEGVGLGVQSVLWSDAAVFADNCPSGGNTLMFAMTCHAVNLCKGMAFEDPQELLDRLLPEVLAYGRAVTGRQDLRMTFALNALVPVDFAAWVLYAREKGIDSFDGLIPESTRSAMAFRQEKLGRIPLITYGMGKEAIEKVLDGGEFLLKIKIGSDPEGDHDPRKMLEWDKNRLTFLHELAKDRETPYTENGRIAYYLDANGRYPDRDTLLRFLDHADQIGALSRIVLLEEPLDEENDEDLSDVPVRVAADESAHCEADAVRRMDQGYRAVALKPIAKTLSMTFRILEAAHQRGIPCFCADLTVNPVMLEWNKNVAARIGALPGIRVGVVETNGDQNYKRWEEMCGYEPCHGADFTRAEQGVFHLGKDFYRCSGGILEDSPYYSGQFGGEGK